MSKPRAVILLISFIFIFGGSIMRFYIENVTLCSVISIIGWFLDLSLLTYCRIKDKKKKHKISSQSISF